MSELLLFISTLLVLLVVFGFLVMLRRPVYQLTELNVIRLLELVLAGEASEDDWNVFVDIPIRYNDELEKVRVRCAEIADVHGEFSEPGCLFSKDGLHQLKQILDSLKQERESGKKKPAQ